MDEVPEGRERKTLSEVIEKVIESRFFSKDDQRDLNRVSIEEGMSSAEMALMIRVSNTICKGEIDVE